MNRLSPKLNARQKQNAAETSLNASSLSAFEKEIINKSLLDIKEGRVQSHAAVMKQAAEWLREK
jgi:hypothetical protein